jgi:hypothetical protein
MRLHTDSRLTQQSVLLALAGTIAFAVSAQESDSLSISCKDFIHDQRALTGDGWATTKYKTAGDFGLW